MATYIALLRGINVGRNKRISMQRLRELLDGLGYADVRTHLQSGNAVFSHAGASAGIAVEIERAIESELGMDVRVIVRTATEWAAIVAANALARADRDQAQLQVLFLSAPPKQGAVPQPVAADVAPEEWQVEEREIYLWCPAGVLKSELMQTFTDKRLGVHVTARNWRTVLKLAELAGAPG